MIDQFRQGNFRTQKDRQFRGLIIMNFLCVMFLVACGGVFIFFYSAPTEAKQPPVTTLVVEKEPALKMVDVLIPLRMIDSGEALQPAMFKQEPRPEAAVSERIVRDFSELNGSYARSVIMPGEPLNRDYLTGVRPTNVITSNIPEGYRAVTISVDVKSGVEGWARPGARVDVAWTSTLLGKPGLTVIVQNALVLSAERQLNANAEPGAPVPSTISLLVSAKDAAKIQLASTTGQITLSLRGDRDHGKGTGFSDITVYDLLGRGSPEDGAGDSVEGFARFSHGDGKTEEMVIINGQLIRKSGQKS
jgi:pilus assembly protein CpaB